MKKNELNLNNLNNIPNFLIISKPGAHSTKHTNNYITFKKGDFSLKIDINNPFEKNLKEEKIFQTLSNFQKNFIEKEIQKFSLYQKSNASINQKMNKEQKNKFRNNMNLENLEDTHIKKNKKEFSSIVISDDKKLSENFKENEKENLKEIEKNFCSSINKKSIRTQLNKKDIQKSMQQSDRAEVSKMNSESENVTDFDNKTKIFKFKYDNGPSIKGDINENEKIENELIDNEKDLITELNNNKINNNEKIIFKQDSLNVKKNNFIDEEKNENENKNQNQNIINNISKENKLSVDGQVTNANPVKQTVLVPIYYTSIIKKNIPGENNKKNKNKKVKTKPVTIITYKGIKNLNNSIPILSNRNGLIKENTYISRSTLQFSQQNCFICERLFYLTKLFCSNCGIHFLCQKCAKNYYEDAIENKKGSIILKCPNANCDKCIDYDVIKKIINESHQKIYEKNKLLKNDLIYNSINLEQKYDESNVKMYSERHVLDISNNMNFYLYKKSKDIFCPKCLNPNLFSKTNNEFIKCLNCNYKICKHCLKEFTPKHLDIKVEGYCKVYFRKDEEYVDTSQYTHNYFMQLLFVVVMYLFTYIGVYLFFHSIFKEKCQLNNHKNNFTWIKKLIVIIICSFFLILCCPLIIICYPFFPALIALCDY